MDKCLICKNQLETRSIELKTRGAFGKLLYSTEKFCSYCEWKGNTGAGKQLKDTIKEMNHDSLHSTGVHQD